MVDAVVLDRCTFSDQHLNVADPYQLPLFNCALQDLFQHTALPFRSSKLEGSFNTFNTSKRSRTP